MKFKPVDCSVNQNRSNASGIVNAQENRVLKELQLQIPNDIDGISHANTTN
jgi:hypothetical protein